MQDDLDVNIAFIEEIQKHPQLYDRSVSDYQIHTVSEKIWKDIADKFDDTVESCKCKWKSIRSSYIRHLKKKGKRDYYLAKYLVFLAPFTRIRVNIPTQDLEEDDHLINIQQKRNDSDFETDLVDQESSDSENKTNLKREFPVEFEYSSEIELQKRKKSIHNIKDTNDHYKSFLLSLYPHIETFSKEEFHNFQMGVSSLINKIKHSTV